MMSDIYGILNDSNVTPSLLAGLQQLESEYGDYDSVGFATLMEGRIRQQQTSGKLENLQNVLQKQPIQGHRFGIAYTHRIPSKETGKLYSRLCANEHLAIVHNGAIKNKRDIKNELFNLGYQFDAETDEEIILRLISRYLDIGMQPEEATLVTVARLQGYFATIALFANPNSLLIAARRGSPLAIGVNNNILYVSSNTNALTRLSHQVIQLEEGHPAVLRSVNSVKNK